MGEEFKEGVFKKDGFEKFSSFISKNISRKLKDHQLKAAFHLYLMGNGANFSVPGSGKTTVVLSVFEKLRLERKVNMLFVVGPPSCFGPWRKEFYSTFGREPYYKILAGGEPIYRRSEYFNLTEKRPELVLTTFQTLQNDRDDVNTLLNHKGNEVFFVIDEAHYIKKIGGIWANTVLFLAKSASFRCVLTGTPLPKSYIDVFNLFDFLWPEPSPIDAESKIKIRFQDKESEENNLSAREILRESIGPFYYRVKKCDLNLIPPVFHPPHIIPMNKYEKKIYDAIKKGIINYAKDDYLKNIDIVEQLCRGRIIRLRQCVSYAKLISNAIENYNEEIVDGDPDLRQIIFDYDRLEKPAKLEYLLKLVKIHNRNKEKVVIWANFIGTLELIVGHLRENGLFCELIYGKTPTEQNSIKDEATRETIRNKFVSKNSGLDILVANPAACAESISLHKNCYHAIYYDLSYNCAQYLQSLDRIHRVGGSEFHQANYHILQYQDTMDQDIFSNLNEKANRMYSIIEEDCSIYSLDMFEDDGEVEAYKRIFGNENIPI